MCLVVTKIKASLLCSFTFRERVSIFWPKASLNYLIISDGIIINYTFLSFAFKAFIKVLHNRHCIIYSNSISFNTLKPLRAVDSTAVSQYGLFLCLLSWFVSLRFCLLNIVQYHVWLRNSTRFSQQPLLLKYLFTLPHHQPLNVLLSH